MRLVWILIVVLIAGAGVKNAEGGEPVSEKRTLRLFSRSGGEKHYYTGYDWLKLDIQQKMETVEHAREGAIRMNTVMSRPAEVYIAELDRMYALNESVRHIEVGQAIQGIAISLKDWDDGSDPDKKLDGYLTKAKPE